jgi:hypothetical protein
MSVPSRFVRCNVAVSEARRLARRPPDTEFADEGGRWVRELGSWLGVGLLSSDVNMEASRDWRDDDSGVTRRLENWAEDVWSETRRLARLSGSEDTASLTDSTRPRLGLGAITCVLCIEATGLSGICLCPLSLVVSRYLEAAVMAAAVSPAVAISIWRVLMMLSAVIIGFRALLGLGPASDILGVRLMALSREAAP